MSKSLRRVRFAWPFRTAAHVRAEVNEELQFDLEMRTAALVASGLSQSAARTKAIADFGDLDATRKYCEESDMRSQRHKHHTEWLSELRQDVSLALRGMRRTPALTCVVLLTLALGIGVNTAVFSVVRHALFGQLPYANADRLVRLYGGLRDNQSAHTMLSANDIIDLQHTGSFTAVAPFGNYQSVTFRSEQTADVWNSVQVGPQYFRVLGVRMALGRALDERDVAPDAAPAVVLTHGLWKRAFGNDSAIVGKTIQLDGKSVLVSGVLPADFVPPDRQPDVFAPLDLGRALRNPVFASHGTIYRAIGRLAPGASTEQVRAQMENNLRRKLVRAPDLKNAAPIAVISLRSDMLGAMRLILSIIMFSAVVVLMVVSVNIAGLYFARSTLLQKEIAVRMALGAGRARLVRQLLTESVTMGMSGCMLGLVFALWVRAVLSRMILPLTPLSTPGDMDGLNMAFAIGASLLSAFAFGLAPALAATRVQISGVLSETSRGASGGRRTTRTLRALVVAQVASAVVLVTGAGLLVRTITNLERDGMGFETGANLLTFSVMLPANQYADATRQSAFFDALTARVAAIPAVTSVGRIAIAPWNGYTAAGPDSVFVEGRLTGATELASVVKVSEDYFRTMGIPLRGGREFSPADREGQNLVAIVSANAASRYWPGRSAVGQHVRIGHAGAPVIEVVGVAGEVRDWPGNDFLPTVYVSMRQSPIASSTFIVRTTLDAANITPAVRNQLHNLDSAVPLVAVRTLRDIFDGMLGAQRLPMFFVGAFAIIALVLAALGVYGVLTYVVTARAREFGIRAALGAEGVSIIVLVLRQAVAMIGPGVGIGLIVALMATRLLDHFLVGVNSRDPATVVATVFVMLVVGALAAAIPAMRAVRADPIQSLRSE